MKFLALGACAISLSLALSSLPASSAGQRSGALPCSADLGAHLPTRPRDARTGSAFARDMLGIGGTSRDRFVVEEVLSGNIPGFLRHLTPVTLQGETPNGDKLDVTICVTPDYLAIGNDKDFVRVPMGLPAAAGIAVKMGFLLPTTKMVDAIHAQAELRLPPAPMPPTSRMTSTDYFWQHNQTVSAQLQQAHRAADALAAGQKKDIVLTNRLRAKPGRVAIYGWHRGNGRPIQPLSTVHGKDYADYSHGVRLVSSTAFVNGKPLPLTEVLQNPQLAPIVSSEGPIPESDRLLAALR